MGLAHSMDLVTERKRCLENLHDRLREVIGGDAINGQRFAFNAFVDQHQLASWFTLILVPALLHGQPDRFHRRFARGQTVPCGE
jgi:hypothetical protein